MNGRIPTVAVLASLSLFVFKPLEIYLSNIEGFSIPLGRLSLRLLALAILGTVVGCGLLFAVPRRRRTMAVALAFALSVVGYVQSSLLVWDYGLLDGDQLRWEAAGVGKWLELLILFAAITLAGRFPQAVSRWVVPVSLIVVVAQAGGLAHTLARKRPAPSHHYFSVDEAGLTSFSSEANVILILLDQFQSTTFDEIIAEDSDLRSAFEGFTYFPNATAGYAKTLGSVPNMLTGQYYENAEPYDEYLRRVYRNSILARLADEGFDVEVYPWHKQTVVLDQSYISNLAPRFHPGWLSPDVVQLLDLSLFRHVPHFGKQVLVGNGTFPLQRLQGALLAPHRDSEAAPQTMLSGGAEPRDWRFLQLIPQVHVARDKRATFKFIHLQGPHAPWNLDEDFVPRSLPGTLDGYRRQARADLRIVALLVKRLQELGIYDDATIIVSADHGAGEYGIPVPGLDREAEGVGAHVIQSGLPLLIAKPPAAQGEIRRSNAPVSLADLPATIAKCAGSSWDGPGESIFEIAEDAERTRRFLYYTFHGWNRRYLPPLAEFLISGFSWSRASWRDTGARYQGREEEERRAELPATVPMDIGDVRTFGRQGTGQSMMEEGWSIPEGGFVWSDGNAANMKVLVKPQTRAARLVFTLVPFSPPTAPRTQRVIVDLEGQVWESWTVSKTGEYALAVPARLMRKGEFKLGFTFPDAISPHALRTGNDARRLAVRAVRVRLEELPMLKEADLQVQFGVGGNAEGFSLRGWSRPERGFTWTQGHEASLVIPLPQGFRVKRILADVFPLLIPGSIESQTLTVSVNGREIGTWSVADRMAISMDLRTAAAPDAEILRLDFALPDAHRPPARSNGTRDGRTLGLRFYSLTIIGEDASE